MTDAAGDVAAAEIASRPTSVLERNVQEPKPYGDVEPRQASVVVLEIAERWLDALADRPFEVRLPVDVWAMGTRVRGTSDVVGHYTIRCVEGNGALCFVIHARGMSAAETRGRNRAVTIHTTTVTQFQASKRIELRDGTFANGDTVVEATQTLSVQSRIEPHRRIGRRLVHRVARQRMHKQRDEIKRVRRQLTEQLILDAMDRSVEQATVASEELLRHVRMGALWLVWYGDALPLQLQTGENCLRLAYCRDVPDNGMMSLTVAGSGGALRVGIASSIFQLPAVLTR